MYNPNNEKVISKMKKETSPGLMLDSFKELQSKSFSYSYANPNGIIQKQNKKEYNMPHTTAAMVGVYLVLKQDIPQTTQYGQSYTTLRWRNKSNCL